MLVDPPLFLIKGLISRETVGLPGSVLLSNSTVGRVVFTIYSRISLSIAYTVLRAHNQREAPTAQIAALGLDTQAV